MAYLVEALALETAAGDGEVDERHARAYVRRELDRWITSGQEYAEGRRQIDVLVAEGDEHSSSGAAQFPVQHRIQYRIVVLHVL